jgi:hypothetical protein
MRAFLDLESRDGGHAVCVRVPGGEKWERAVRWTGGGRLLVYRDDAISDEDAAAISARVEQGSAAVQELARYGGLLFEAAFGEETWRELVERSAGEPYLELAIRGDDGQEPGSAGAIQALHWEGLYDGVTFVAARGTVTRSGRGLSVGIVRLVPPANDRAGQTTLDPIQRIPRVLFAVGSRLTDPKVRPGAEFMGIIRHLERDGGSIQPRVLQSASLPSLTRELARFQPDVLHLIGHGRWFPVAHCLKLQLQPDASAAPDLRHLIGRGAQSRSIWRCDPPPNTSETTGHAEKSAYARPHIDAGHTARTKVTSGRTKVACRPRMAGACAVSARQDHKQGGYGEKGHVMTHEDDLPAEVRKQDEEAELQIAAQLAELRQDAHAAHGDDLPAEARKQDEEAELQVAAQLAELRQDADAAHGDDLPAEVRKQDEEAELQVAAQLAELRKNDSV